MYHIALVIPPYMYITFIPPRWLLHHTLKPPKKYTQYKCKMILFIQISPLTKKSPPRGQFHNPLLLREKTNTFPHVFCSLNSPLQGYQKKASNVAEWQVKGSGINTVRCVRVFAWLSDLHKIFKEVYTYHLGKRSQINRTEKSILNFLF